jgi:hypothetical protein
MSRANPELEPHLCVPSQVCSAALTFLQTLWDACDSGAAQGALTPCAISAASTSMGAQPADVAIALHSLALLTSALQGSATALHQVHGVPALLPAAVGSLLRTLGAHVRDKTPTVQALECLTILLQPCHATAVAAPAWDGAAGTILTALRWHGGEEARGLRLPCSVGQQHDHPLLLWWCSQMMPMYSQWHVGRWRVCCPAVADAKRRWMQPRC